MAISSCHGEGKLVPFSEPLRLQESLGASLGYFLSRGCSLGFSTAKQWQEPHCPGPAASELCCWRSISTQLNFQAPNAFQALGFISLPAHSDHPTCNNLGLGNVF